MNTYEWISARKTIPIEKNCSECKMRPRRSSTKNKVHKTYQRIQNHTRLKGNWCWVLYAWTMIKTILQYEPLRAPGPRKIYPFVRSIFGACVYLKLPTQLHSRTHFARYRLSVATLFRKIMNKQIHRHSQHSDSEFVGIVFIRTYVGMLWCMFD